MTRRKEETMAGESVELDVPDAEPQPVADQVETPVQAVVDDVLSPSEYVEMYHPDLPTGSNGEPNYSSTSRSAFDQVWRDKGWCLRPDPYARPAGESDQPQDVVALEEAHPEANEPQRVDEVAAPNDKE